MKVIQTGLVALLALGLEGSAVAKEPQSEAGQKAVQQWKSKTPAAIEKSWDEKTKTLTIRQNTKKTIVDGPDHPDAEALGYRVVFRSDVEDATLLVRVNSGRASRIRGLNQFDAEQKVIVINPIGMVVSPSGNWVDSPEAGDTIGIGAKRQNATVQGKLEGPENLAKNGNIYALAVTRKGTTRAVEIEGPERAVLSPGAGSAPAKDSTPMVIHQSSKRAIINWNACPEEPFEIESHSKIRSPFFDSRLSERNPSHRSNRAEREATPPIRRTESGRNREPGFGDLLVSLSSARSSRSLRFPRPPCAPRDPADP